MRTLVVLLCAAAAAALLVPSQAAAAPPLKECGNRGISGSWTYGIVYGAGIFEVVARVTDCPTARRVATRAYPDGEGGRVWYWRSWRCHYLQNRYELSKIRCTARKGRLVQWITGA